VQEGSTLKAIRLTQLQACPENYKKIVPKLFEQTTYRVFTAVKIRIVVLCVVAPCSSLGVTTCKFAVLSMTCLILLLLIF
jgi:hypothetical protein